MRVAVASMGETLDDQVSDRFGRCPLFLLVDTDTMSCEALPNPGVSMPGGAGPAAVQALADQHVTLVLAGEFGPKAQRALDTAGIRAVKSSGVIREAVSQATA